MESKAHLWCQGQHLAPAAVGVRAAVNLAQLGRHDARDACAEDLALVVEEDAGVVVEAGRSEASADALTGNAACCCCCCLRTPTIMPTHRTTRPSARCSGFLVRTITARRMSPRRTFWTLVVAAPRAMGRALLMTHVTSSPGCCQKFPPLLFPPPPRTNARMSSRLGTRLDLDHIDHLGDDGARVVDDLESGLAV